MSKSTKISETMGTATPVTNEDIAAFRVGHPLDSTVETGHIEVAPGAHVVQERICFEIFAFHAEEVGEIIFDVRGIKDALADRKLQFQMFDTPLVQHWIEHIREKGGVEAARMKQFTAADLERPAIALYWPHGYTTVIDGNNRIVRRWDDGLRTVRMAVVKIDHALAPYMCRPGGEEQFMKRRLAEDPRGMTPLGYKCIGAVGGLE
jgi:hypothetical protein